MLTLKEAQVNALEEQGWEIYKRCGFHDYWKKNGVENIVVSTHTRTTEVTVAQHCSTPYFNRHKPIVPMKYAVVTELDNGGGEVEGYFHRVSDALGFAKDLTTTKHRLTRKECNTHHCIIYEWDSTYECHSEIVAEFKYMWR